MRIGRLTVATTLALMVAAVPAALAANVPEKQVPTRSAHVRLVVKPGETIRWRSSNIGPVNRLSLTIAGRDAAYAPEPKTRNCVAYGYEAGVAVRMTDCRRGRRVPYVRLRAVSAARLPTVVVLRLN